MVVSSTMIPDSPDQSSFRPLRKREARGLSTRPSNNPYFTLSLIQKLTWAVVQSGKTAKLICDPLLVLTPACSRKAKSLDPILSVEAMTLYVSYPAGPVNLSVNGGLTFSPLLTFSVAPLGGNII